MASKFSKARTSFFMNIYEKTQRTTPQTQENQEVLFLMLSKWEKTLTGV